MAKGPLGAVLARDIELLGRKPLAPLSLGDCDLALFLAGGLVSFVHRWNTFGFVCIYSIALFDRNISIGEDRPKSHGPLVTQA
jgi:hypothetical protein